MINDRETEILNAAIEQGVCSERLAHDIREAMAETGFRLVDILVVNAGPVKLSEERQQLQAFIEVRSKTAWVAMQSGEDDREGSSPERVFLDKAEGLVWCAKMNASEGHWDGEYYLTEVPLHG